MDTSQSLRRSIAYSGGPRLRRWLPWLWVAGVAALLFWLFRARGFDDPFITYRYADNLAAGMGFVYNAGEQVLSTTTPLYALLLAGARLLGFDVPLASNAIGCLSLALGGLALWYCGRRYDTPIAGVAGLLLYPLFPPLILTIGSEVPLYVALILFGFLAVAHERDAPAAVLLALATLVRADGVLAAVAAGAYVLAVRRGLPWRAVLIYTALLIPWFTFAWLYFGAPFPVTLVAKQRQGLLSGSRSFYAGLTSRLLGYWELSLALLHQALAAAGLIYGVARARRWLLLIGWNALYALAYSALGVTSYPWYYGALAAGSVALVGLGVEAGYRLARRVAQPLAVVAGSAVLLAALFISQTGSLLTPGAFMDNRLAIYRAVGEWLHDETPADARVGALEVGIIGYYAGRRMIDFAGLIQPETALRLTPTTTYQDAALWAFERFRPDYLVLQQGQLPRLEQSAAVKSACRAAKTFTDPGYRYTLVVYACKR